MRRIISIILFLITALWLPYWIWAPIGLLLSMYFQWYLEAPVIAMILEAATTSDGSGVSNLPIATGLILAVGLIEIIRPRLAERRARITL